MRYDFICNFCLQQKMRSPTEERQKLHIWSVSLPKWDSAVEAITTRARQKNNRYSPLSLTARILFIGKLHLWRQRDEVRKARGFESEAIDLNSPCAIYKLWNLGLIIYPHWPSTPTCTEWEWYLASLLWAFNKLCKYNSWHTFFAIHLTFSLREMEIHIYTDRPLLMTFEPSKFHVPGTL